jgi:hypothetical protein
MVPLRRRAPEAPAPGDHFAVSLIGWIGVGLWVFWLLHRIWPALFIPWWFNTDEVVFYYEVIRKLRLDPSQTFFDIPGTPYMSLTSVLVALWWVAERLVSLTKAASPSDFAFENVQGVFTLMRSLTLAMYLGAVALAFDLFRRCAGTLTAVLAAFLFASLPIHVHYSYFVRTESLGLVMCLSGIWIVLYSRWRGTPKAYGIAGALAGVAMAARYHFALVGFPVILAIFFLCDREELSPPASHATRPDILYDAAVALAAFFVAGGAVTVLFKAKLIEAGLLTHTMMLSTAAGLAQYSAAKETVAKLWLLLAVVSLAAVLFHQFPRGRSWIWPVINRHTLLLTIGFAGGFLLSHPVFLWRGEYQLKSIQFYSDWIDPTLASLGPFRSWWNVSTFYFATALPERLLQVAFVAGAGIILWRRQAVHLAFLVGAVICAFAHPMTMKLWAHHVIPWLPFLCFVAAVPAGLAGGWLIRRYQSLPAVAATVVMLAGLTVIGACSTRLQRADEYLITSRARTEQIGEMNRWLSKNVPADAYVLVSYYALNEDGFLKWIESVGVRVPESLKKHRNMRIWWLERSAIDGQTGFLCASRADIAMFRADFERRNPGSTYNPFEDKAFEPKAEFGGGYYQLQVFQFDFRRKSGS